MSHAADLVERLAGLRREFDTSFAAPRLAAPPSPRHLLAVRAGSVSVAVRLGELAGVLPAGRIVPMPCSPPGLLGLAGLRGRVIAVHDLGAVLGAGPVGDRARWLLLAQGDEAIALAAEAMEGYLLVPDSAFLAAREADGRAHATHVIEHAGTLRGVLDVRAIVAALSRGANNPSREQE